MKLGIHLCWGRPRTEWGSLSVPWCDLSWNEKCEHVDARCGMLTVGLTCIALASASVHFDGSLPMVLIVHHTRQTEAVCTHQNWPYTLAHHDTLRLLHLVCSLPPCKGIPGFRLITCYNQCCQLYGNFHTSTGFFLFVLHTRLYPNPKY